MRKSALWGIGALVALCFAGAGIYWWRQPTPTPAAAPTPAPPVAVAPPVSAPAPVPAEPAIRHPIDAADAASANAPQLRPLPSADKADAYFTDVLTELLGKKSMLTFVNADNFANRFVVTVDNLDRAHAASRLWPVNPTPARFVTVSGPEDTLIGAENARRYTPFVQFVAAVDSARAVALYKHLYPLFQKAYEDLGYPGKYFNDRVVAVIDHLLQTPEPAGPLKVKLTEVKGPIESATPWLRYEYADTTLEALSSGQKILLRTGTENARQLKAKLAEVRRRIASGAANR
jgi:hypothetical protein